MRRALKYRNKPTNGYASAREAKRAGELKLLERAGEIRNLREQVPFELIPKQDGERAYKFVADFVYEEKAGDPEWRTVVEDCKGFRNRVYLLKRKLFQYTFGMKIRET